MLESALNLGMDGITIRESLNRKVMLVSNTGTLYVRISDDGAGPYYELKTYGVFSIAPDELITLAGYLNKMKDKPCES